SRLDEQDLDRLAFLLEVERDMCVLADAFEAARRQRPVDRVPVGEPGDEIDVRVVVPDASDEEVERPTAAQPEGDPGFVERPGDLREQAKLTICDHGASR